MKNFRAKEMLTNWGCIVDLDEPVECFCCEQMTKDIICFDMYNGFYGDPVDICIECFQYTEDDSNKLFSYKWNHFHPLQDTHCDNCGELVEECVEATYYDKSIKIWCPECWGKREE